MGRIKTMLIKRAVNDLIEKYGNRFTNNFEKNKKVITQVADIPSKKVRNVVAGYITKLIRKKKS